jgi:hypothetical protein
MPRKRKTPPPDPLISNASSGLPGSPDTIKYDIKGIDQFGTDKPDVGPSCDTIPIPDPRTWENCFTYVGQVINNTYNYTIDRIGDDLYEINAYIYDTYNYITNYFVDAINYAGDTINDSYNSFTQQTYNYLGQEAEETAPVEYVINVEPAPVEIIQEPPPPPGEQQPEKDYDTDWQYINADDNEQEAMDIWNTFFDYLDPNATPESMDMQLKQLMPDVLGGGLNKPTF